MPDSTHSELERLIAQSFVNAFDRYGDLGLEPEAFSIHLSHITKQNLGLNPPLILAFEFVRRLHTNDLYLAAACAHGSELAWGRFVSLFEGSIRRICKYVCSSQDTAREMADTLPGQLFLPDATGRSRIASYKGISPLLAWLVIVIKHRAESERRLKANNLESIDRIPDVADQASVMRIEAALRAGRYASLITDCLQTAVGLLSERERVILHLRYERQLQVREMARMFGVKPPAITKQIDRTRLKLREEVSAILATRHKFGPAVIEECLAYILENPEAAGSRLDLSRSRRE